MIQKSLALAEELQGKIEANISNSEKEFHAKMQKLLNNPENKVMLIEFLTVLLDVKIKEQVLSLSNIL